MAHTILFNQQQLLHLLTPMSQILHVLITTSQTPISQTPTFTTTSTLRQQETYDDFNFESLFLPHHNLPA